MKRIIIILLIVYGKVIPAMAFLSMPIADDAGTYVGQMRVTGSMSLESDLNLFGGRLTYGIKDGLAVFGGFGLADPDTRAYDVSPYFQVGGQHMLPVDLPVDIAVRAAFGISSLRGSRRLRDLDIWTVNVGALASRQLDQKFTVYGYGGLSHQKYDAGAFSDTELDPAIAVGAILALDRKISFFGEFSHIDDLFVSLGARFDF